MCVKFVFKKYIIYKQSSPTLTSIYRYITVLLFIKLKLFCHRIYIIASSFVGTLWNVTYCFPLSRIVFVSFLVHTYAINYSNSNRHMLINIFHSLTDNFSDIKESARCQKRYLHSYSYCWCSSSQIFRPGCSGLTTGRKKKHTFKLLTSSFVELKPEPVGASRSQSEPAGASRSRYFLDGAEAGVKVRLWLQLHLR